MYFTNTRYSNIDFSKLNELSIYKLETMLIMIEYEIAEYKADYPFMEYLLEAEELYCTLNLQLKLVIEEIAERILLD